MEITTATEELNRMETRLEQHQMQSSTIRADLDFQDKKLTNLKIECKTHMGKLRDEEGLGDELAQKLALLEDEVKQMEQQEDQLKGHSNHLAELQAASKERQVCLKGERTAMEEVVETLTRQN